jgi:predicted RecB family nuclease
MTQKQTKNAYQAHERRARTMTDREVLDAYAHYEHDDEHAAAAYRDEADFRDCWR